MEENRSLWQEESLPDFPVLEGDTETEVLIIGGGLCGIFDSLYPVGKGDPRHCDRGGGDRGRRDRSHTGKVTAQHGFFCRRLTAGWARAWPASMQRPTRCGMERPDAAGRKPRQRAVILSGWIPMPMCVIRTTPPWRGEEAEAALLLGFEAEWVRETELPFSVAGAVCFHSQGCSIR